MNNSQMELTKAVEQIMQILWKIEKGFIKDILEYYGEPKPAYTTIATIIKILDKKGFVSYKSYGNTYQYYPLISKKEYSKKFLNKIFGRHFEKIIFGTIPDEVWNAEKSSSINTLALQY